MNIILLVCLKSSPKPCQRTERICKATIRLRALQNVHLKYSTLRQSKIYFHKAQEFVFDRKWATSPSKDNILQKDINFQESKVLFLCPLYWTYFITLSQTNYSCNCESAFCSFTPAFWSFIFEFYSHSLTDTNIAFHWKDKGKNNSNNLMDCSCHT